MVFYMLSLLMFNSLHSFIRLNDVTLRSYIFTLLIRFKYYYNRSQYLSVYLYSSYRRICTKGPLHNYNSCGFMSYMYNKHFTISSSSKIMNIDTENKILIAILYLHIHIIKLRMSVICWIHYEDYNVKTCLF